MERDEMQALLAIVDELAALGRTAAEAPPAAPTAEPAVSAVLAGLGYLVALRSRKGQPAAAAEGLQALEAVVRQWLSSRLAAERPAEATEFYRRVAGDVRRLRGSH